MAGPVPGGEHDARGRRRFLVAGAAGAAAAVAAAVTDAAPAGAANGDNLKIGQINNGTVATTLIGSSFGIFWSGTSSSTIFAVHEGSGAALRAVSAEGRAADVEGVTGGIHASATAPGARAISGMTFKDGSIGIDVSAFGAGSVAVQAQSPNGPALRLEPGPAMPPTTGVWQQGDVVMDKGLWFCTKGGTGSGSRWVKLSTAFVPLATPKRIYDSRAGQQPTGVTKGKIGNGQERVIDATLGGVVPTGISAVQVNVTVTETGPAGYLSLFRNGTAWPGTSSINWAQPATTVANGTLTSVDATSKFTVRCAGETHFVIDVLGYYA